jgi:hypothetical protein
VSRSVKISLLVLAAVCLLSASASAAGHHKVLVKRDVVSEEFGYRPHAIGLSGDGTFFLYALHWAHYGQRTATAKGRALTRGCEPNCAQGREFKPTVKIRLSQVNRCGKVFYFGLLHYSLQGHIPTGFRRQGTLSMAPAGEGDTDAC